MAGSQDQGLYGWACCCCGSQAVISQFAEQQKTTCNQHRTCTDCSVEELQKKHLNRPKF
jgi:hypothetical protein